MGIARMEARGAGTALVVVADEIEPRDSRVVAMMHKTGAEVVDDVVAEVGRSAAEARVAVFVVGEQAVVNGDPIAAAPGDQPIKVAATALAGVIELARQRRFLQRTPLNGYVGGPCPEVDGLILGPGQREVVEHGIVDRRELDAVPLVASSRRRPHAQKTHHHVMDVRPGRNLFVPVVQIAAEQTFDGNARPGCGLAGDGDTRLRDRHIAADDSGYFEDDDPRTPGPAGRTEASRARWIQVSDLDHAAATAPGRIGAKSLGAREGRRRIVRNGHARYGQNRQGHNTNRPASFHGGVSSLSRRAVLQNPASCSGPEA